MLSQPQYEDESVRHLVQLGYVDPDVVAARDASLRSQLDAEFQRATKLYTGGQTDEAVRLLDTLAVDDPDWTPPHQLLAEIYYRAGSLEKSQTHLDWLAEHGFEHPRYSLIRGALALARRDVGAAIEELEFASHAEPELPSVHTLLGSALLRSGRLDDAEGAFQKAIDRHPADAAAYDGLAATHLRRGEFEDAANLALTALEHDMQLFRAHYHLGVALAHLDRPQEAITAFETAMRIDANRAAPYRWLSQIASEQLADAARADRYLETARDVIRRRRDRSS